MNNYYWNRKDPQIEVIEALEKNNGVISFESLKHTFIQKSYGEKELNESLSDLIDLGVIVQEGQNKNPIFKINKIDKRSYKDFLSGDFNVPM